MKVGIWIGAAALVVIAGIMIVWLVDRSRRNELIDAEIMDLRVFCTIELSGDIGARKPACDRIKALELSR